MPLATNRAAALAEPPPLGAQSLCGPPTKWAHWAREPDVLLSRIQFLGRLKVTSLSFTGMAPQVLQDKSGNHHVETRPAITSEDRS